MPALRKIAAFRKEILCPGLLCFSIWLGACSVGPRHTPDLELEHNWSQHEAEFESLLAEVQADSKLETLQPDGLIYAGHFLNLSEHDFAEIERLGMTKEHWASYQKTLHRLKLAGGVLKGKNMVEFRVDPGSIFNGDSYKGYYYASKPPGRLRSRLDDYRIADEDKDEYGNWSVCKRLKGNWYLYLFVNR